MFNLRYIDLVVSLVGADPLDPDNCLLEIHRHHQAIVIALDIENNPVGANDARCGVETFNISRTRPVDGFAARLLSCATNGGLGGVLILGDDVYGNNI